MSNGTARCPNCGQVATDSYDIGSVDYGEFDCNNENCRCQVFRTVRAGTDRSD